MCRVRYFIRALSRAIFAMIDSCIRTVETVQAAFVAVVTVSEGVRRATT